MPFTTTTICLDLSEFVFSCTLCSKIEKVDISYCILCNFHAIIPNTKVPLTSFSLLITSLVSFFALCTWFIALMFRSVRIWHACQLFDASHKPAIWINVTVFDFVEDWFIVRVMQVLGLQYSTLSTKIKLYALQGWWKYDGSLFWICICSGQRNIPRWSLIVPSGFCIILLDPKSSDVKNTLVNLGPDLALRSDPYN